MEIKTKKLTKTVPLGNGTKLTILHDISLTIETGEIFGITGVSGSGKTTLLTLLAGLDRPTRGRVTWNKQDLNRMTENERAKLRLGNAGFIFQNFELLSSYTALENVLMPLELTGAQKAQHWAQKCLKEVGLEHRLTHYPNQLSGGEQQRVAIARAFAISPKVLFADEPTASLDQKTSHHVIELLTHYHKQYNTTIIFVTHDENLSKICHRRAHLQGGKFLVMHQHTVKSNGLRGC